MQAKLLRIIQEKEFERLGSNKVIKADLRFVAASNKDLNAMISQGVFREDLFYRLNVFPIKLPPLRKRRGDIPLLLKHFLEMYTAGAGSAPKTISEQAMQVLQSYYWPGNVRELQNLVERLVTITNDSVIHLRDIAVYNMSNSETTDISLKGAVSAFEKQYIYEILDSVNWNRKKAAEKLGIHRNTLLAKTNELGLNSKKN